MKLRNLEALVGERVRQLREDRGLSQAELGRRMGLLGYPMEQPTVYKSEKGLRPLRLNEIEALAVVLAVPIKELLGREVLG